MAHWNIFVLELENMLLARGMGLGHLDDRAFIHPEKVSRLRLSLRQPFTLPVLNVEELDSAIAAFNLDGDEVLRLRAAILAVGVQAMLVKRIHPTDALAAAEQVFPYVLNALYQSNGYARGLALVKGSDISKIEGEDIDLALGEAWDAIDNATVALHLSYNVASVARCVYYARESLAQFEKALGELSIVKDTIKSTEEWQVWHEDAQKGVATAQNRLAELGA